jgi:hypothetical protein
MGFSVSVLLWLLPLLCMSPCCPARKLTKDEIVEDRPLVQQGQGIERILLRLLFACCALFDTTTDREAKGWLFLGPKAQPWRCLREGIDAIDEWMGIFTCEKHGRVVNTVSTACCA